MDVLPQNSSECALSFFLSQSVTKCSFGREETFRENCLVWFLFPRQVVPQCICWAQRDGQGSCLVTGSMGQMISYRDQRNLAGSCGVERTQDGKKGTEVGRAERRERAWTA